MLIGLRYDLILRHRFPYTTSCLATTSMGFILGYGVAYFKIHDFHFFNYLFDTLLQPPSKCICSMESLSHVQPKVLGALAAAMGTTSCGLQTVAFWETFPVSASMYPLPSHQEVSALTEAGSMRQASREEAAAGL